MNQTGWMHCCHARAVTQKDCNKYVISVWFGGQTNERTYLLFSITVAADSPQVFESSPKQDYEETPKESDHGGGEESPPHSLAIAVTGHVWRKRDDHIHLGYVNGRIRVESLPVFRHYRYLDICQPQTINSTGIQALWGAPASAPWCHSGSAMLSQPPSTPLPSHLASTRRGKVGSTANARRIIIEKKLPLESRYQTCVSRCAFMTGIARHPFDLCVKITYSSFKL